MGTRGDAQYSEDGMGVLEPPAVDSGSGGGLSTAQRREVYSRQRNGGPLTPRQRRRLAKKDAHRQAGNLPVGRIRKRHEAKERRAWMQRVRDRVDFIHAARDFGGVRKLLEFEASQARDKDEK